MARFPRERMTVDEAETLCGARVLREAAGTAAAYSNWRTRGVPWEVVGPLAVEQLSLASEAHSHFVRHGGPDMHAVLDLQGRIFRLARDYGPDSKEFRAVRELLTVFVPEAHSNSAAVSRLGAEERPRKKARR